MTSVVQDFVDNLLEEAFQLLTKEQLIDVAVHFGVELSSVEKRLKHTVKSVLLPSLVEKSVLPWK